MGKRARRSTETQEINPSADAVLRTVQRRFEKFRREHPSHTRIPLSLRQEVVEVLELGAPRAAVQRACGVSSKQLKLWSQRSVASSDSLEVAEPKVFSVVDVDSDDAMPIPAPLNPSEMKFFVGGWCISIQPERQPGEARTDVAG